MRQFGGICLNFVNVSSSVVSYIAIAMFRDDAPKLPCPMMSKFLAASDSSTEVTTDILVLQFGLNYMR